MAQAFFETPILNSPYELPDKHWELDENGQPTHRLVNKRRKADFFMPIPQPRRRGSKQGQLDLDTSAGLSTGEQKYQAADTIQLLREKVGLWRRDPNPANWKVTPTTQRLLEHWRKSDWEGRRPFFCQVEAVETMIWLTEVAPTTKNGRRILESLEERSRDANPELFRIALKLATGAGKTTVMAMLIAWQTLNALRAPNSKRFTRGFLVIAPGITIRDRLRVLQPNDPDSYYEQHAIVPTDMQADLHRAKIVITNYHAFKLREKVKMSSGTRRMIQGRGPELDTLETDGDMMKRVMAPLMGVKNIWVLNDEAHHCYREKPKSAEDELTVDDLKGDERKQAKKDNEAARLWINGIEAVGYKLGVNRVIDLSATPFFLKGSGYREGTIFPWVVSDFSLMDAIECGIVKLPRVPVADNIPTSEMPIYRDLWGHIRKDMPKKGRGKNKNLDPRSLPTKLQTALESLYGHYQKTFDAWRGEGHHIPPCFIIVCNNTATSKLIYDYISGFRVETEDESEFVPGALELFRNFDDFGNPLARPNTLLIDSEQLESGDALDRKFRAMASDEIERFRREIVERSGNGNSLDADEITDQDLLREVMNTVGKPGRLGEQIRCVVSVSMLTEGWDANTVTHILGVRAFGTQLLCEQVIGRALRRYSYDLNDQGLFDVEYADILGIPFDFAAEPVVSSPQRVTPRIRVTAVRPERDALTIRFPRVAGYRTEQLPKHIEATFTDEHKLRLTPELVGATQTHNRGIIGEETVLTVEHLKETRPSALVFNLTTRLLYTKYRDENQSADTSRYNSLKRIVRKWLKECLVCEGETMPNQLLYQQLADLACERINQGINQAYLASEGASYIRALLDPYNPEGSTEHVRFDISANRDRWETDPRKCHVNFAVLDSGWEGELCRIAEADPRVLRYVKNQNLGFEVPYRHGGRSRRYLPDFILVIDDGHGPENPLQLVVEIKGYRGEAANAKKHTMQNLWVPGVNNLERFGRWDFVEITEPFGMEAALDQKIAEAYRRALAPFSPTNA